MASKTNEYWPDLGRPRPKVSVERYETIVWPETTSISLPWAAKQSDVAMSSVLAARRTRRSFGPLPLESLAALLQTADVVTEVGRTELGFPTSYRPAPSAGAIHPVHVVISRPDLHGWYRYDPFRHALVGIVSSVDPAEVRQHVDLAVATQQATLIMLVAERAMTAATYENPASLVWRDAGILLGYLSAIAESLGLNFCLLGATGEPWASRLVDQPGLKGVGLALAGSACLS